MKKSVVCLVILVLSLVFALNVQAADKSDKEPIKIGAIFAVTGSASWLGEPEKKTTEMYIEKINEDGGINGHIIQLIVEDTEGNATKAVNAINKLITKDQVVAIIGPSRSGTTMAVIPIAQRHKIPLISCAAASVITEPVEERKWIFKTPQLDSDAAIRIFEYMKKKGYKKIAIITGTTGFGDQGRKQLKKYAPKYGIKIVADETYGPKDTDMTAQLTKIRASEAEALVNWSIVPAQAIVAKNLKQLKMDMPLYQSHGFGNINFIKACGKAGEGIIFPAGRLLAVDSLDDSNVQKKVLEKYKKAYEDEFNEPVSTFGGHAYDAVHILKIAMENIRGDINSATIRDEIEKVRNYVGTGGIFNFSEKDHTGLTKDAFALLTIKNGKFVVLEDK